MDDYTAAAVQAVVDSAPPLTPEQADRIRALLSSISDEVD